MSDQIKTNEPQPKDRIGYGVKIPTVSFEDAIRIIKEVARVGGMDGGFDALSTVTQNTVSSSTLLYKVYALKGFGLLTFQGKTYSLTELGRNIVQPESAEQEGRSIVESFSNHTILNKVWDNYKGKILPQREYLANYFEKNLEIPAKLKLGWADYFIAAAMFARLLHERESGSYQVLSTPISGIAAPNKEEQQKSPSKTTDQAVGIMPRQAKAPDSGYESHFEGLSGGLFYQKKISDNRKAMIYIPEDLTESDIVMIRAIIKSVDAGLEGLKRHEPDQQ
jgi:hypothetical protein